MDSSVLAIILFAIMAILSDKLGKKKPPQKRQQAAAADALALGHGEEGGAYLFRDP